jgi:hypothetical protein
VNQIRQRYNKVFQGKNCHIKFLLWIFQNILDYKFDSRCDLKQLSIFTIGGSQRELPWILRGFTKISGKDTFFFGDVNKVKTIYKENI